MLNIAKTIKILTLMAEEYQDADHPTRVAIKAAMNNYIRKFDNFEIHFISEAAKEVADDLGLDMSNQYYNGQSADMKKYFILEHKYPVSDMLTAMFEDPSKVEEIINARCHGWILRTEDKLLPRYNRGCHDTAYNNANIKVINF